MNIVLEDMDIFSCIVNREYRNVVELAENVGRNILLKLLKASHAI